MTRPKGIPEAVEAAKMARRTVPDLELHLFGDPDTSNPQALSRTELERLCDAPGVHWHGQVSGAEVPAVIARHHAVMLLSHREGLPRTLVEACASARAVVATDVTGCREIIRDGNNGILVPLGDAEAAARALVSLAMDDPRRAALARAGRALFEAHYSEAHVKARFMEFYRSALKERPPSPGRSADEAEAGRRR
jgi:glycosyltransferase involved in cell wall biosynthesis